MPITASRALRAPLLLLLLMAACLACTSDGDSAPPATVLASGFAAPPAGCPCALPYSGAADQDAGIAVRVLDGLGPTLVTPDGMTLYTFAGDSPGRSTCVQSCAERWPPFLAASPPAADRPGEFSILLREDGTPQMAFRGKPLYRFAGDRQAGDALGHGADSLWSAALTPP